MISVDEGARTSLHCACATELSHETGLYYDACQPMRPSAAAQDKALAVRLWDRSLEWVNAT